VQLERKERYLSVGPIIFGHAQCYVCATKRAHAPDVNARGSGAQAAEVVVVVQLVQAYDTGKRNDFRGKPNA